MNLRKNSSGRPSKNLSVRTDDLAYDATALKNTASDDSNSLSPLTPLSSDVDEENDLVQPRSKCVHSK